MPGIPLPVLPSYRTPGYYPAAAPHSPAVLHAASSAVRTAVLDRPKEILGVNNAQCLGDGQYPRPPHCGGLLIVLAAGSLWAGTSVYLSISQYISILRYSMELRYPMELRYSMELRYPMELSYISVISQLLDISQE